MTWLTKNAKDLRKPLVVFTPALAGAGGYFYHPERSEVFVNGRPYTLRKGLLLIAETNDEAGMANSIAHEWRHYWQWFNLPHRFPAERFDVKADYESEIKRFFRNPRELDALVFSHKVAPSWVSEMWLGWVR